MKTISFKLTESRKEFKHNGENMLEITRDCVMECQQNNGEVEFPSVEDVQEIKVLLDNYLLKALPNPSPH